MESLTYTKEGGWGWCVTAASFIVHFVICGIGYCCGLFHHMFTVYYEKNNFETAWIGSLMLGLTALAGIPGLMFTYMFGHRPTVIIGGIVAATGFGISVLCNEMYEVYLTVGALTGIGFGLALTPSVLIIDKYFYEKKDLAASIAITGSGIGILAFPVAVYHLEHHLAWKGMALVLSGVCANIIFCGACMKPVSKTPDKYKTRRNHFLKMFRPSLFCSPVFCFTLFTNILWGMAISIIYTYLPYYILSTGETLEDAAIIIAITGIANFSSRAIFQIFSHTASLDNVSTFLCTVTLSAILTGLHTQLFEHKAGQIGYALMLGLYTGYWTTFSGNMVEELIGPEYVSYGKGYLILSLGLGLLGGAPLAGWMLDELDDIEIIFYFGGAILCLASLIMMSASIKKCYYRPRDWSDSDSMGSSSSGSSGNKAGPFVIEPERDTLIVSSVMSTV